MQALVAANRTGVTRAAPSGEGWASERVLEDADVRCLAAGPGAEGVVWAGTEGDGLYRSDDAGRSWRRSGLRGVTVKSVAASSIEPGVLYAGTKPARVFRSRDGGESWEELESFRRIRGRRVWFSPAEKPFTAYVQALALSPTEPGVVLAGIEFGAVVRSDDGGATWSGHRRRASRDCHSLQFHPHDGRHAYEGGGTGPAASRDAGVTWDRDRTGLDRRYCWAAAADPGDPETWFVSAAKGPKAAHGGGPADARVFRRRASAWEPIGTFDSMPYGLFHVDDLLHAGLADGRVLRFDGEEWTALPVALGAGAHAFAVVP